MKLARFMLILATLVVPFAPQLHAQTLVAAVLGSPALFTEAGQGAANALGCVSTINSQVEIADSYGTPEMIEDYGSAAWVAWTPGSGTCAAPGTDSQVYVFVEADSAIGLRCLFRQSCILFPYFAGSPPANLLPGFTDTPVPGSIFDLASIIGSDLGAQVAATDILPLDALFATYQALAPCGSLSSGTQYQGYGRDPGSTGTGTPFLSSFNGNSVNVREWLINGTDPYTGIFADVQYTITAVGAAPVLIFVNTSDAGGFGSPGITNVTRETLGLAFSNVFARTVDFIPQAYSETAGGPITAIHRESIAGVYNVFDRAINNNKELYNTQEQICPPVEPMDFNTGFSVGTFLNGNLRAVGMTNFAAPYDLMIREVFETPDSIGYSFWNSGQFSNAAYGAGTSFTSKYLTVDGVDPLCSTYGCGGGPGEIPTAANGLLANVNLKNVANGNYPIWSEQRFVSINPAGTAAAQTLAAWAQEFVSFGAPNSQPDFVTTPNLNVIHAHFALPLVNDAYPISEGPRVCGSSSGVTESGGDAGGIVTSLQAASDFAVLKGNYNTAGCAGITDAASFGVHQ